jgi:hypothetical protein
VGRGPGYSHAYYYLLAHLSFVLEKMPVPVAEMFASSRDRAEQRFRGLLPTTSPVYQPVGGSADDGGSELDHSVGTVSRLAHGEGDRRHSKAKRAIEKRYSTHALTQAGFLPSGSSTPSPSPEPEQRAGAPPPHHRPGAAAAAVGAGAAAEEEEGPNPPLGGTGGVSRGCCRSIGAPPGTRRVSTDTSARPSSPSPPSAATPQKAVSSLWQRGGRKVLAVSRLDTLNPTLSAPLRVLRKDENRQLVSELRGHSNRTKTACVYANNTRVLSASDDNTLRVWDIDPKAKHPRGGAWIRTLGCDRSELLGARLPSPSPPQTTAAASALLPTSGRCCPRLVSVCVCARTRQSTARCNHSRRNWDLSACRRRYIRPPARPPARLPHSVLYVCPPRFVTVNPTPTVHGCMLWGLGGWWAGAAARARLWGPALQPGEQFWSHPTDKTLAGSTDKTSRATTVLSTATS